MAKKISDKNKSDYCFYCNPIYTILELWRVEKICVIVVVDGGKHARHLNRIGFETRKLVSYFYPIHSLKSTNLRHKN